jgi:hypothetical protein
VTIHAADLRELVVRPVLERMERAQPGMLTPAAIELLMGTAAHESLLGKYLRQQPGPARGIYQMEPATFHDLMTWLDARPKLRDAVMEWASPAIVPSAQVAGNLFFATAVARASYWRKPFAMPAVASIPDLAAIWKRYWNTSLGKGTVEQFVRHYRELVD